MSTVGTARTGPSLIEQAVTGAFNAVQACGTALKAMLDEQERAVAEDIARYHNALAERSARMDEVIDMLADVIVINQAAGSPAGSGDSRAGADPNAAAQRDAFQARVASLERQMEHEDQPGDHGQAMDELHAQLVQARQDFEIQRAGQAIGEMIKTAEREALPEAQIRDLREAQGKINGASYAQASAILRQSRQRLDIWLSNKATPRQQSTFEQQRARRDFAEASQYVQQMRLYSSQDIDLKARLGEALERAEVNLQEAWAKIDGSGGEARTRIISLHATLSETVAKTREELRYNRAQLKNSISHLAVRMEVLRSLGGQIQQAGLPINTQPVSALAEDIERLTADTLKRSATVDALQRRADELAARASDLRATLEQAVSRATHETMARTLQAVLTDLNYTAIGGQAIPIEPGEWGVRVAGYQQTGSGKAAAIFQVDTTPEGDVQVLYDFSGYAGAACQDAKHAVFEEMRRRGFAINEEQHIDYESHMHSKTIASLQDVLKSMGYSNIEVRDIAGAVTIEAYNNGVGYTVKFDAEGVSEANHRDQFAQQTPITLEEIAAQAQEAIDTTEMGRMIANHQHLIAEHHARLLAQTHLRQ